MMPQRPVSIQTTLGSVKFSAAAYVASDMAAMKPVLSIMKGEEFQAAVSRLPGYRIKDAGMVKTVGEVFRQSG